jgi:hypothetical protein
MLRLKWPHYRPEFRGNECCDTLALGRLSQVSPPIRGITLNLSSGAVSVAPKTASGVYNLVYQICEIASPANCDTATVTLDLGGGH